MKRLRDLSIRGKLLWVILVISLAGIASLAISAYWQEQISARAALESELQSLTRLLASRSEAALAFGDAALAEENVDALAELPKVEAACIYDVGGALFASYRAVWAGWHCPASTPLPASLKHDADGIAEHQQIGSAGQEVGHIVVRASLQPLKDRLADQLSNQLLAASGVAAISVLLALWLQRLILRPLLAVRDVATEVVASGNLALRAPVFSGDEVGQLAHGFNRMLQRLEDQQQSLHNQADYSALLFRDSPVPLVVIDTDGSILDCNDEGVRCHGFRSRSDTIGRNIAMVSAPRQYDGQPAELLIQPYVAAALAGERQVFEWLHQRPDGSHWDAEVHLSRFFDGESPRLLCSLVDITERRRAATALEASESRLQALNLLLEDKVRERTRDLSHALENLKRAQGELLRTEKMAALGSLVAGVAHELNTPIGNALTVASTIEEQAKALAAQVADGNLRRSQLQEFLDVIHNAGKLVSRNLHKAHDLVSNFKQVAVDQTSAKRRRFDLHDVVEETLSTLRPTLKKTAYVIANEVPKGFQMDSFPGAIGQILTNLVNNSVLHGFADRPQGTIRVTARAGENREPRTLLLEFSDNGAGMSEEVQRRAFDPFFTTRLGQGGSGLGLNIVYNIVSGVLGGQIELHSEPGAGTRFTLELPMQAPDLGGRDSDAA